ncbi:glycosyltransferase [Candidatus Kryptobacter tengchongensis]|uniref:Glycosyltransferase, catalytic subunit of cellulose synthase and poly-beta-1,6-N-acetylglucosamine synthase n=1 Tax=Kryptobacter tengchongensis TaxID=1643429 RepID=A0A656D0N0_KRYT1|nr:glycosyltransferase [Candidatus Kryptobacter tengchongensis]CUS95957.1 Glycosyltransferase, catalytic subunit of cellulose synthase and poly-beta-1,6-N-acetylglucosamine synthase [Candidatus Kryptobacter tengchongensis]
MFDLILVVSAIYYSIEIILFLFALNKDKRRNPINTETLPDVSVVVAARNEEENIERCVRSILELDYPKDKLEIIVANDGSTDRTEEIVRNLQQNNSNLKLLNIKANINNLKGKANALAQAIDKARGEIIFMTDADCAVPKTWIKGMLKYFDEETGVASGITIIESGKTFYGMQSLDWAFLLGVAASVGKLFKPVACIGNNMAFRKKAYVECGGYQNLKFSITEDFALFKAITSNGKWKYAFPVDIETLVISKPLKTWKELYHQKKRWGTGGLDTGPLGISVMIGGYIFHLLLLLSPLFINNPLSLLLALSLKLLVDGSFLFKILKKLKKLSLLKYLPFFELYYIIYVVVLPFIVFFGGKTVWKERQYKGLRNLKVIEKS